MVHGDLLRDLPEWLEKFSENLLDERVPAIRDTPASSSRESDPEPSRKLLSAKHSIRTHFPKGHNCGDRTVRAGRSPKNTSENVSMALQELP